jgi:hypothetical protein
MVPVVSRARRAFARGIAVERERREAMVYGTVKALVEDAAERWTIENLGADWPSDTLDEIRAEIGDAVDDELNDWRAEAKKYAAKVVKAKMPLTLASMEALFWNRKPDDKP